jgi:hypothetical protein
MSKRKINSAYYSNQISKRSPYVQEMRKAVKLYEESKIEREATLKNIFNLLKARGEKSNKKGVELLNKFAEAEPAKGKIQRHEGPKRDNMIHFHSRITAIALDSKVKTVEITPNVLGAEAGSQVKRIVVEGFNTALKAVGKDKAYHIYAGCTIIIESGMFNAFASCKNHTDNAIFKKFLDKFVARIEEIMQSLDITTISKFQLQFKFIEIPSGAGTNATQDRSKASIFLKKSVIKIVNDDNSCFWHALAVLLNENHPQIKHIKEGRNIRTLIARDLCNTCNMEWNTPVSINEIENIEDILKCNIYVFDIENLPILNSTSNIYHSLMYKSQYVVGNKQCYLLFDNNHFHCITNPKAFLATYYYCPKCCSCFHHKVAFSKHCCSESQDISKQKHKEDNDNRISKDMAHYLRRGICKGSDEEIQLK